MDETPIGVATTIVLNRSIFNLGTAASAALGGPLLARGRFGALGAGLPALTMAAALYALTPAR